ncbi:TRAP transporter large permease subunit [Pseudomonas sp. S 311-6]|uniref:TRAP transporter large permease protein n=1 Tax=Kerstersia gyiorum TaxID=206506 RepID=A0A171KP64_9BURK|nr:TRAP transporter large permease subunit [Kerstersia gyiorum]MCO7637866.1 TRAP transporter large permease subunit [Pseudomonas sp. S 311-6]KAB0542330.1 TRAP transporter large permease subunit [Kerstersia gyiorum]KKO70681.1 C4-dicarboxylate ABC transporter permease [Kerstersia gyiorum]MCR4160107.1 TRAP transporter large permease subunit [Kerstersia gyiorum]RZS65383.1 tripartite ATP-independent transporter DctM subunit [Kerstersia gyiorum]
MDPLLLSFAMLGMILVLIGLGLWVYASLFLVSIGALYFIVDFDLWRIANILSFTVQRAAGSWELSAIPLFIWMGELLLKTNIAREIFAGLTPLVRYLPGRLAHINIIGCTVFASICGSSAATTATVGKITVTELARRGYRQSICLGGLAGAGSLGLLIPPSIVMIVYGVLAEAPIDRLFAAGILPGLMLAGLFSLYIIVYSLVRGEMEPGHASQSQDPAMLAQLAEEGRWRNVLKLVPLTLIIGFVLGSIYAGWATPSEAAAIGVLSVLVYALCTRCLTLENIIASLRDTLLTSVMILGVILAATLMSTTFAYLHIPAEIAQRISDSQLSIGGFLLLTSLFFLAIGLVLDGVSIIVMTLPIFLSIIKVLGIDPVWFGIYMIIMVEIGQITPPVGFNLMVIKSLSDTPMGTLIRYSIPYFLVMCFAVFLLCYFPQIALFLPDLIFNK